MEFEHLVKKRKSVREFSSRKVSWKNLMDAVDCALHGPFAGNINNLKFLIVEDKDTIKAISEHCEQDWIADAEAAAVICSDESSLESIYGERGRIYSRQQAGAAIYAFLLKLTELGIGSCWVGAYNDEMIRMKLDIPSNILIEAIVPIGYSKGKNEKKEKKPLENSLFWEKWGRSRRPTIFEEAREDMRHE